MGAHKYIQELLRGSSLKSCARFFSGCAAGSTASSLRSTGTLPTWSYKAHRLGYKAKHGYIMYWILVRCGGCKRPVSKGATCGNLSITVSTSWSLLEAFSQFVVKERAGRHCGALSSEVSLAW